MAFRGTHASKITTTYEFECGVCGKKCVREILGDEEWNPGAPSDDNGYWVLMGPWICNDHDIIVIVDGGVFCERKKQ